MRCQNHRHLYPNFTNEEDYEAFRKTEEGRAETAQIDARDVAPEQQAGFKPGSLVEQDYNDAYVLNKWYTANKRE